MFLPLEGAGFSLRVLEMLGGKSFKTLGVPRSCGQFLSFGSLRKCRKRAERLVERC